MLCCQSCSSFFSPCSEGRRQGMSLNLNFWVEDWDSILHAISETELKPTPPPSAFQLRDYRHVNRSPHNNLHQPPPPQKKPSELTCLEPDASDSIDHSTPDPPNDESHLPGPPSHHRFAPDFGNAGHSPQLISRALPKYKSRGVQG